MAVKYNFSDIDSNDLTNKIYDAFNTFLIDNGYNINDPQHKKYVSHNEIIASFRYIANTVFKPNYRLESLYNYNDIELFNMLSNIFLNICFNYNKSIGLVGFAYFLGVVPSVVSEWMEDSDSNFQRKTILKNIQIAHKQNHISLLNESTIGQIAVANNDNETGLLWSDKMNLRATQSSAYYLPSESVKGLENSLKALPLPPE